MCPDSSRDKTLRYFALILKECRTRFCEYMAAGRAIVATDVGANGQLIEHGIHGLLVPAKDEEALAGRIAHLLDKPCAAKEMAEAARKRVEAKYSREAMVRRFEDFYEELLAAPVT